ncbi:MAG: hypothetical protein J6Y78_09210 [Paludibacteraceae bacterium]|nr:hypothetical protein [Paludibacteraceae bacterium]
MARSIINKKNPWVELARAIIESALQERDKEFLESENCWYMKACVLDYDNFHHEGNGHMDVHETGAIKGEE